MPKNEGRSERGSFGRVVAPQKTNLSQSNTSPGYPQVGGYSVPFGHARGSALLALNSNCRHLRVAYKTDLARHACKLIAGPARHANGAFFVLMCQICFRTRNCSEPHDFISSAASLAEEARTRRKLERRGRTASSHFSQHLSFVLKNQHVLSLRVQGTTPSSIRAHPDPRPVLQK